MDNCSLRTCPMDIAWIGLLANANGMHPPVECSNEGMCNRETGECACFTGYEGIACQRTACPFNCNNRGTCFFRKQLAIKASRTYSTPWDASKHYGCICDAGFRGWTSL